MEIAEMISLVALGFATTIIALGTGWKLALRKRGDLISKQETPESHKGSMLSRVAKLGLG